MTEREDFEDNLSLIEALDALAALRGDDPEDPRTILLLAFRGWNDAGEAASGILRRMRTRADAPKIHQIIDEKYYDYQVLRPRTERRSDGRRSIRWPGLRFFDASRDLGRHRVIIGYGAEPSFLWRTYADQVMAFIAREHVDAVILLGAMLADSTHTRPLPTFMTSEDRSLRRLMGLDQSAYEGPTGMLGILSEKFSRSGLPTVSAWVSIPHYVSQAPSPKAELALLGCLEELFGTVFNDPQLLEEVEEWTQSVNGLVASDSNLAEYLAKLERAIDAVAARTSALRETSGEEIAEEFSEYLRTIDRDDDEGPQSGKSPSEGPLG